jgi:prepilin-type N-terminal cleavage/methylation domain-containing protein
MGKTGYPNTAGFTLVEVMISTLILGAVLAVTFTALTTYRNAWEKSDSLFSDVFTRSRYRILVRQAVESIYGYYVTEKTGEQKDVFFPLFRGSATAVEFVTLSSVFDDRSPALARLSVEKITDDHYNIVYEETPLVDVYIKYPDELPAYKNSIEVYTGLSEAGFRYYGVVDIIFHPELQTRELVYAWNDQYLSKQRARLPEIIALEIDSDDNGKENIRFAVTGDGSYKHGLFNPPFKN